MALEAEIEDHKAKETELYQHIADQKTASDAREAELEATIAQLKQELKDEEIGKRSTTEREWKLREAIDDRMSSEDEANMGKSRMLGKAEKGREREKYGEYFIF